MLKINKKDLINIKELLINNTISYGKFTNKQIIEKLELNGSITILRKSAQRKIINLIKEKNVYLFLKSNDFNIFSIVDFGLYISELCDKTPQRAKVQKWHGSTKIKNSHSLKGLYISSLNNLEIKVNDEVINIVPTNGIGYFCFYTEKIIIDKDTVIVGVENYQVIWFAKKYKSFFKQRNILFVVRNTYMREWICNISNEYIHFGDYDLGGINIFVNEIIPILKKCKKYSMFIPDNIEELIKKYGSFDIYKKQSRYMDIIIVDEKIKKLKNIIIKYKKGLEQEGLYLL